VRYEYLRSLQHTDGIEFSQVENEAVLLHCHLLLRGRLDKKFAPSSNQSSLLHRIHGPLITENAPSYRNLHTSPTSREWPDWLAHKPGVHLLRPIAEQPASSSTWEQIVTSDIPFCSHSGCIISCCKSHRKSPMSFVYAHLICRYCRRTGCPTRAHQAIP